MDGLALTLIFLLVLFTLLGTSVWIGISLLAVAWVGMELFTSRPVGDAMALTIWSASSSWTLTALPLFVWMGEILFRTKLSENLFKGLQPWLHGLPGGLLHVNITGSAIFAAICGSSAATVLTVGKMAVPELKRRNYPENMVIGTLAGAGTLGLLIPPSIIFIIYGVTVNESIVKLFIAGILPGLMLAGLFMGYTREAATRYAFLLAIPAVLASGFYQALDISSDPTAAWGPTILATIIAFLIGYAVIAWLIRYVSTNSYMPFVLYRIGLGTLVLVLLGTGVLVNP